MSPNFMTKTHTHTHTHTQTHTNTNKCKMYCKLKEVQILKKNRSREPTGNNSYFIIREKKRASGILTMVTYQQLIRWAPQTGGAGIFVFIYN